MTMADHIPVDAVSEEVIRERAYALYEKRGCEEGHAEEDWLRAESELFGEMQRQDAA
jgi:Protein of unknown function (DUF2934)